MRTEIRRVAVLGAGVMGSGIAAHLANAGIQVLLLDIVPPKLTEDDEKQGLATDDPRFRNRFAAAGLEGIKKSKPAALYSKRFLPLIEIGNFEDDWDRMADCDWIIEVVVERLDIKQQLFEKIEEVRKPGCIISSNTSGLSIKGMTEGRSEEFRQHFLVTHFFNPVRYMRLLELVAGEDTLPEVMDFFTDFGRFRLGFFIRKDQVAGCSEHVLQLGGNGVFLVGKGYGSDNWRLDLGCRGIRSVRFCAIGLVSRFGRLVVRLIFAQPGHLIRGRSCGC